MEFHEKLQRLRKDRGLTQEELAEKLYVSRAAVSKWELGRGYPNIESLKDLAAFFSVSVDELLSSEDVITLAEKEKKESIWEYVSLICALLDLLTVLLLFIPVFGAKTESSAPVSVFALSGVPFWEQITFISVIGLTVINGLVCMLLLRFDEPDRSRYAVMTGMALSIIGSMVFMAARQPYAGAVYFLLFLIKIYLSVKEK